MLAFGIRIIIEKETGMKLSEIKDKIAEVLANRTIDDFYADCDFRFAKEIFLKLTNLGNEGEIEKYLEGRFPETLVEKFRFKLEGEIKDVQTEISEFQKKIGTVQPEIDSLAPEISKVEIALQEIPGQIRSTELEIEDIVKEIAVISPLATKSPYDKQIEGLQKQLNAKSKHLASFPANQQKLATQLEALQKKSRELSALIAGKHQSIAELEAALVQKRKLLDGEDDNSQSQFENEYAALEFLFLILLRMKIGKNQVIEFKETGRRVTPKGSYNSVPETIEVPTGDFVISKQYACLHDFTKQLSRYLKGSAIVPKGWRRILDATLATSLPKFSGFVGDEMANGSNFFKREKNDLSEADVSTLLSLKASIRTSPSITTDDRGIIIGLSGGLFASIVFREKGESVAGFQENSLELYVNCLTLKNRFLKQTLYHQSGYATGHIDIVIPGAYYLLTTNYVIEIYFNASAILLNQNHMASFAHDISSKAKQDDDDRRAAEDEFQRQQSYWDYDDD